MKKVSKIIFYSFVVFYIFIFLSAIYDLEFRSTMPLELKWLLYGILSLPLLIYYFRKFVRHDRINYLKKNASYTEESLINLSLSELEARLELVRLNPSGDYRGFSSTEVFQEINEIRAARKPQGEGGMVKAFEKGLYGTNKLILCVNCGQRMRKGIFGDWNTSTVCYQARRSCVPYEPPSA